jgi:integrase
MAKISEKLTDTRVKSKGLAPGSYPDGQNLYLRVKPTGSRSWVFRYKISGKVREIGLGSYPARSLAEAREKAGEMRTAVQNGLDPKSVLKPKLDPSALTFADYAADFITGKKTQHRSLKAHAQWTSTLAEYCGQIAHKRPAEITYRDIELIVAQPKLATKRETCQRVLQRIRNIMDYAAKREGEPGRFNPALAVRLPKRKPGTVRHHAAAKYETVPAIMAALKARDSMSALVLRFSIATAARSGMVRDAEWNELNLDQAMWEIPAHKMKNGLPFRQPLNAHAIEALNEAKAKVPKSRRVFPGPNFGKISDVAINKTLSLIAKEVGLESHITAHGFRSSFRQWGAEQTQFPHEALELCLAHVQTDKVVAAYQRSDLYDIRKLIMAAWASHCGHESGENVVPFSKHAS